MSRKTRRSAPPPETTDAKTEEPELEASEPEAATALEALERAELPRGPSIFLLAYLRVRGLSEDAPTLLEELRKLRGQPWAWSALLACDYVKFTRALSMCGLELVTIGALQGAVTAIEAEARATPERRRAPADSDRGDAATAT